MIKKRIIKQLLVLIITSVTAFNAYAVASGMYVGIMTGPASNTGKPLSIPAADQPPAAHAIPGNFVTVSPRSNQWGVAAIVGYQINKYAAGEVGLDFFNQINYKPVQSNACSQFGCTALGGATVRVRAIDIVAKGSLPFYMFDVYAKAGGAVVYYTTSPAMNAIRGTNGVWTSGPSTNQTKFRPMLALGASYDIDQNWVADVSWNQLMVGGNVVGNVNFYTIGISYHFVDKYCGQFLC